jgi:RNA polymerase sigma-70 factor (ECF subfamily)
VKRAAGREAVGEPAERGGRVLPFPERALSGADDPEIVRILQAGDPRGPRMAWQRLAPMVHRLLKRAFGPNSEIDDLVQEVFLVFFDRVGTLREPKALPAFVMSITAHTIRRELRRKAALRWLHFGDAPSPSARETDLDSREAVARLYVILDRLRADDRTAFVLRFLEGLSLVDVAGAMGVSLATAKRLLARAWDRIVSHAQRDPALVEYVASLGEGTP